MTSRRWIQALALSALCAVTGCATTQDLGGDAPQQEDAGPQGLIIDAAPTPTIAPAPTAAAQWSECPTAEPIDRAPCDLDVAWCAYPFDPEHGVVSTCSCGADQRWTCLRMRDTPSRLHVSTSSFTNTACTEGAPCSAGVRCALPKQRTCTCASSGRFVCSRPAE